MTLMPVSKISVLGSRSVNLGVSVHRLAQHVEDPAQRRVADRRGDRRAGIHHRHAAGDAVGAAHGDRAHLVLPDVLLHFGGEADRHVAARILQHQGVVDLGQVLGLELDVEHRADHLHHAADGLRRCAGGVLLFGCDGSGHD